MGALAENISKNGGWFKVRSGAGEPTPTPANPLTLRVHNLSNGHFNAKVEFASVFEGEDETSLNKKVNVPAGGAKIIQVPNANVYASLEVVAATGAGRVRFRSKLVGDDGNDISVAIVTGATGGGNEYRALAVAVVDQAITITRGTDGSGNTVPPTPAEIKTLIEASEAADALVVVEFDNDGDGDTATLAVSNLQGGINGVSLREKPWLHVVLSETTHDSSGPVARVEFDGPFQMDTRALPLN